MKQLIGDGAGGNNGEGVWTISRNRKRKGAKDGDG